MSRKKFIFFPSGRKLWYDLADRLDSSGVASPIAWIGDSKLDDLAKSRFPECDVYDFSEVNSSLDQLSSSTSAGLDFFFDEFIFYKIKEKAIRMMDRHDPYGAYRSIDREAFFNESCLFCLAQLKKWSPDFLLFVESPHSPFQYVMYEVANYLNIKTLSFYSWGIGPVLSMREGIAGSPFKRRDDLDYISLLNVEKCVGRYIDKFDDDLAGFEPDYMKRQKEADSQRLGFIYKSKAIYSLSKKSYKMLLSGSYRQVGLDKGVLLGGGLAFLEPIAKEYFSKKIRADLRDSLSKYQEDVEIAKGGYVYFPLHYEPERTTVPDGAEFYDQFKAILALRKLVPKEIPIYVKEHYSQFTSSLEGYRGRSFLFYSVLSRLDGVKFIPIHYNGRSLIENSICTSTITGTAALEAACLGIPALIFGNPWFIGAPGVVKISDIDNFGDLLERKTSGSLEIKKWLLCQIKDHGVFGCVNPSNENLYSNYYSEDGSSESELSGVFGLVLDALSAIFRKR